MEHDEIDCFIEFQKNLTRIRWGTHARLRSLDFVRHRNLLHRGPQTSLVLRQVHISSLTCIRLTVSCLICKEKKKGKTVVEKMKFTWTLCGLLLISGFVASNPIVKRDAENDLSPLNEVYVFEADDDQRVDDERTDRDKRKIGIVKLGVSNGVINFVFGKLDAFLDAKTKALAVLDESNKAKNAAFGIDNSQSATSQFIGNLVSQKIQAGTASIGPVISSASTFFNSAKSGLTNAFVSKLAPLSSIAGGLSGGGDVSVGGGVSADSGASSAATSQLLGNLLSSKLGVISNLSSASNSGTSGSSNGNGASGAGAAAGINLGAFANLGGYDYPPP
ncbi:hypothetical protein HZH66_006193 [Vespula vulgaris]|uniref:Uncharacterized protein n=1 Tax=Vespula vulgaris TaxID=7454 RepID=A0A834K9Y0_VESVU|nr:hypothetical protein HZH66_006193 [Vespula vulgaris]